MSSIGSESQWEVVSAVYQCFDLGSLALLVAPAIIQCCNSGHPHGLNAAKLSGHRLFWPFSPYLSAGMVHLMV